MIDKDLPNHPVGIHYEGVGMVDGGVGAGSFTMIQTIKTRSTKTWKDAAGVSHTLESGYYKVPNSVPPAIVMVPTGTGSEMKRKTTYDFPVLDTLGNDVSYGFRLNDVRLGTQPGSPPFNETTAVYAAAINRRGGGLNILYGSDSPGSPLPDDDPYGWITGTFTRSDDFTITLMYNPTYNASNVGPPEGPTNSIWIPVGKLEWGYTASAKYDKNLVPKFKWIDDTPNLTQRPQNPTASLYTTTTKFPVWSAFRDGAQKSGFETYFP